MTLKTELKELRRQVERLQVEVNGRESISSMVLWEEQNGSYVNDVPDSFNGLVVHLTHEPSPVVETPNNANEGLSQNEFEELKKAIARSQLVDS
jgi:hypothetical protein